MKLMKAIIIIFAIFAPQVFSIDYGFPPGTVIIGNHVAQDGSRWITYRYPDGTTYQTIITVIDGKACQFTLTLSHLAGDVGNAVEIHPFPPPLNTYSPIDHVPVPPPVPMVDLNGVGINVPVLNVPDMDRLFDGLEAYDLPPPDEVIRGMDFSNAMKALEDYLIELEERARTHPDDLSVAYRLHEVSKRIQDALDHFNEMAQLGNGGGGITGALKGTVGTIAGVITDPSNLIDTVAPGAGDSPAISQLTWMDMWQAWQRVYLQGQVTMRALNNQIRVLLDQSKVIGGPVFGWITINGQRCYIYVSNGIVRLYYGGESVVITVVAAGALDTGATLGSGIATIGGLIFYEHVVTQMNNDYIDQSVQAAAQGSPAQFEDLARKAVICGNHDFMERQTSAWDRFWEYMNHYFDNVTPPDPSSQIAPY